MVKVVGIVENDSITGVKYGTVEVPETPIEIKHAREQFKKHVLPVLPKFVANAQKRNKHGTLCRFS